MITFSNSHTFEYMAASGALAFDGRGWPWEQPLRVVGLLDERLFTTVTKTLTLCPRQGNLRRYNPFGCIRLLPGGTLNAVGLTNPGIEWWCREVGPRINSGKAPVMASILGEPIELAAMTSMLNDFDLVGIEINASCPHVHGGLSANTKNVIKDCEAIRYISRFPIILKLSVVHDVKNIVDRVRGVVEAFSINSVPWGVPFPQQQSPLAHLGGGGISGKIAQPYTWKLLDDLSTMTDIPVIGPSVWDFEDIARVRSRGAKAVSFGSVFLRYPWRPTLFVRRDMKDRKREEVGTRVKLFGCS